MYIGYFYYILFLFYELFWILFECVEILKGLLGVDFIVFYIYDYMCYFISVVEWVFYMDFSLDEIWIGSCIVCVDVFLMGINYDFYYNVL